MYREEAQQFFFRGLFVQAGISMEAEVVCGLVFGRLCSWKRFCSLGKDGPQ